MANTKPTQVTTEVVRISYEHLLQPYAHQQSTEPKFSATLLIPKSDAATKQRIDAAVQAAVQDGIAGKWSGAAPAQPAVPIYDGDGLRPSGEAFGPECKGHWVMTASTKIQPEIVDSNLSRILDATQIYSGMYARVNINFFAYFNSGKKGIGCGLGPVQKVRDGDPLGGRVSAADAFGGAPQSGYAQQPAAPAAGYGQPAPGYQQAQAQPTAYGQPAQGYQQLPDAPQQPQAQQAYAPQPQQVHPVTGQPVGSVMGL